MHTACEKYHAAKNKDVIMSDSFLIRKLGEEYGELCQAMIEGNQEAAHAELADVFNIVTLIAVQWGIDLQQEVLDKLGVLTERTAHLKMPAVRQIREG